MVDSREGASVAILTFWVGPFLLGVEAGQIAQLPRPASQGSLSPRGEGASDLRVTDLRLACGLPRQTGAQHRQLLVVDQAGEKMGYKVDQIGELITIDAATYIWPLPQLLDIQKRWQQLWGVCQWENELVLLVDLQYQPQNEAQEGYISHEWT